MSEKFKYENMKMSIEIADEAMHQAHHCLSVNICVNKR